MLPHAAQSRYRRNHFASTRNAHITDVSITAVIYLTCELDTARRKIVAATGEPVASGLPKPFVPLAFGQHSAEDALYLGAVFGGVIPIDSAL